MAHLPRTIGALAISLFVMGCAASRDGDLASPTSASDTRVELRLRRVGELSGSFGDLRLRESDLVVEYRAAGRGGAALDAGRVTLDAIDLPREGDATRPRYRLINDPMRDVPVGGGSFAVLAHSGGPGLAAGSARIEIAAWPRVVEPRGGEGRLRSEGILIVLEPPIGGTWHRVTIDGGGGNATARNMGLGRWELRPEDLAGLSPGPARLLVEAQTSCSDCRGGHGLAARWSTVSQLELPISLY